MVQQLKGRESAIKKVLWITLFLNLFIAGVKIWVGHYYHYFSLTSSGLDSLFDGSANVLALISIGLAFKPADGDHNYGHGKIETFGSLIIAGLLMYSAVQIGLELTHFFQNTMPKKENWLIGLGTVMLSLATNGFVTWYERKKGKELSSNILLADADHTFGDFIINFGVLISIGFAYLEIYWVDIVLGGIICLYLIYLGLKIVRSNLPELLDASPIIETSLVKKVETIPAVKDIHRFRARGNAHQMFVDFHLLLDETLSLKEAHSIGHQAEDMIKDLLKEYTQNVDVIVHVEPFEENHTDD
jgi:cation diffusion facilitator family transporter